MLTELTALLLTSDQQSGADRDLSAIPPPPACSFEGGAIVAERLSDLPQAVRDEIERQFGFSHGMAEAGEPYHWNDVQTATDRRPQARFVRAYLTQGIWFLWFDLGGIGIQRQSVAMREVRNRATGELVVRTQPGSRFVGDLCVGAKAYLAGARTLG